MGCGGGDAAALGDGVWTEAQGGLPGCGGEKLSALRVLRTLPALSDSRGSLHPPAGPHPAGRSKGLCAHLCEHHARSCRTTPQVCKQCSKTVLPLCALSSALTLKNTMWRRLWRVEFTTVFGHTCTFFGSHAPPMACAGFLRFPGHTCRFSAARLAQEALIRDSDCSHPQVQDGGGARGRGPVPRSPGSGAPAVPGEKESEYTFPCRRRQL